MSNKFGAVKVKRDGYTFDSKAEARRYGDLKLMERSGDISGLAVHPRFKILEGRTWNGKRYQAAHYTADFQYREGNKIVVEDVKSSATKTTAFVLRMKLWISQHDQDIWEFRIIE